MNYELLEHQSEQVILPESVELLEPQEQPPQLREIIHETRVLADGLEVDVRERQEGGEIKEASPYRYSEAYTDSNGVYHPEQITGVHREALENPNCQEICESLKEWQMQETPVSCAVQCQRMIIQSLTGEKLTESQLRQEGIKHHLYSKEGGTYSCDVGKLAELHGLEREQPLSMTMRELVEAKQAGEKIIASVDCALLARPELPKPSVPNHAVEVLGFDFTEKGNPRVILNDPGRECGRGSVYPLDIFERAASSRNPFTGGTTLHTVTLIHRKGEGLA